MVADNTAREPYLQTQLLITLIQQVYTKNLKAFGSRKCPTENLDSASIQFSSS